MLKHINLYNLFSAKILQKGINIWPDHLSNRHSSTLLLPFLLRLGKCWNNTLYLAQQFMIFALPL